MAAGSERAPRRLGRGAVTMGRTEGTASGAGAGRGDGEGAAGGAMLSAAPGGRHLECGTLGRLGFAATQGKINTIKNKIKNRPRVDKFMSCPRVLTQNL